MADALLASLSALPLPIATTARTALPATTAETGADPFAALIATLTPAAPAPAAAADAASTPPAVAVAVNAAVVKTVTLPTATTATIPVPAPAPTPETAKPAVGLATLPPALTKLSAKRDEEEATNASDDSAPQDEDDTGAEQATVPTATPQPAPAALPPIMAALIAVAAPPAEPVAANDSAPTAPQPAAARPATLRVAPAATEPQPRAQPATDTVSQPATAFAAVAALVAQTDKAATAETVADPVTAPAATTEAAPAADQVPAAKTAAKTAHTATAQAGARTEARTGSATGRDTAADRPRAGESIDKDRETAPIRAAAAEPATQAPPGFDHRLRGPAVTAANDAADPSATDASLARTLSVAQDGQWLDGLARDIASTASGSTLHFRLDPVHLGGLSVAIQHDADGATVRMTADRAETRNMLADAQPRLAAEARAQGLTIKHAQIDGGTGEDRASSQTMASNGGTGHSSGSQAGGQHNHQGRDPAAMIETFASETGLAGATAQTGGQTPVTDETARYA